jgi:hypothetical protein
MQKIVLPIMMAAALSIAGCSEMKPVPASAAIDGGRYYAVLLTNGSVYFGKLEGLGSAFPVLHDVFYIQQGPVNPDTKQSPGMVLIHRGKELHAPDRMILSEKSIVFIEPVGTDSRVAELIRQARN